MKRGRKRNVKLRNGLTRQMKGGPAAHKEAVRNARTAQRIAARRHKAWELFVGGATFVQIGQALEVSNRTAWYDVKAVYDGLLAHGLVNADLMRMRQQAELDALKRANWDRATKKGNKASADVIMKTLDREARLNGLDRERKEVYSYDQVMLIVQAAAAVYMKVEADLEKRRLYIAGLRRQLGPALAPPMDMVGQRGADEVDRDEVVQGDVSTALRRTGV